MEGSCRVNRGAEEMREALLVEVKSGKIRHSPWQRIHINDDGYLFVADKNGHLVWVQLVNYEKMMGHELTLPEA